jgi:nicotinate-nucleotide pyrophosphorylase (carboxylating)
VESVEEMQAALAAGAEHILLDDFTLADMHRAFAVNAAHPKPAVLEVSGGVNLDSIRDIAKTGVDRISVGKLTKDVRAADLSWRIDA